MLRSLVRALDRHRLLAVIAALAAFALGWALLPSPPLSSSVMARIVLRPGSPWSPERAADLLRSDEVLVPASGSSAENVAAFRSLLRVVPETGAVTVSTTSARASTASDRANAVVRSLMERAPALLQAGLDAELERTRKAITEQAAELAAVPASVPAGPDARTEALSLKALDREIERLTASVEKGDAGPPRPLDTTTSDRLGADMEAARRKLSDLKDRYPADWPPVARAAADIEDLRIQQRQALNRETLAARFAPVRTAIDRLRLLTAEREVKARHLEGLQALPAPPGQDVEARRSSLAAQLRTLEDRRAGLLAQRGMSDALVERVEPASGAVGGNSSLPWLALLAILAGALAAWIAERLASTIRTEDDIRRHVNLPVLGLIPREPRADERVLLHAAPNSRLAEPFNTAAALLEGRCAEPKAKILGITSARPGEGKSTVAANLALSLARGLARVLLVDADLRRPSQHRLFGLGDLQGLSSYLSGAADKLDSVLAGTEMENLTVLPAGAPLQNPIPFLRSERLRVVLPELKERFDFVIVDLPPVRSAADALVLAPMLDGLILVLGAGETGKDDAAAAKRLIRDARGTLLGCILTKTEIQSRGYYAYAPAVDAP